MSDGGGPRVPQVHAAFLRSAVSRLSDDPRLRGERPSGVRRLELAAPDLAEQMRSTLASYSARSCTAALRAAAEMYRNLRAALGGGSLVRREAAEEAAMAYLGEVAARTPA